MVLLASGGERSALMAAQYWKYTENAVSEVLRGCVEFTGNGRRSLGSWSP